MKQYLPSLKQVAMFAILFAVGMNAYNRIGIVGKALGNSNKPSA